MWDKKNNHKKTLNLKTSLQQVQEVWRKWRCVLAESLYRTCKFVVCVNGSDPPPTPSHYSYLQASDSIVENKIEEKK